MFDSNADIKICIPLLINELETAGEAGLASDLRVWFNSFFTTSSEYLGELKLILEKTTSVEVLNEVTRNEVVACINTINEAFEVKL